MTSSPPISTLKNFDVVFRRGRGFGDGVIRVQYVNNGGNNLRWGVAVSAKQYKRAVDRNSVKRRIREAVRPLLSFIPAKYDIVFLFIGVDGQKISVSDLHNRIQKLLSQNHFLLDKNSL